MLAREILGRFLATNRLARMAAGAGLYSGILLMFTGAFRLVDGPSPAGIWSMVVGWIVLKASARSFQRSRLLEALRGVTVREAMLEHPDTVPAHASVAEAALEHFQRSAHHAYPVLRGGSVVGLLCLEDVSRLSADERLSTSVQGAMRPLADGIVTGPDVPVLVAIARMARDKTARLLVVHDGTLLGLLSMSAVIRRVEMRERFVG